MIEQFHQRKGKTVLNSRGIQRELSTTPLELQPNTLDVKIFEARVWLRENGIPIPNITTSGTILIPSRVQVDIFVDRFTKKNVVPMLRSSIGRLGLSMTNGCLEEESGMQYLSLFNLNPNSILLHVGDRFAQYLFFDSANPDGKVLEDPSKKVVEVISPNLEVEKGYAVFRAGNTMLTYKKLNEPIDIRRKYEELELFNRTDISKGAILRPETTIIPLQPTITLPHNMAIELLPYLPVKQPRSLEEAAMLQAQGGFVRRVNGSWVDSGYEGTITAQIFSPLERRICQGEKILFGLVYNYDTPPLRSYNGKYQGSKGEGHKNDPAEI